MELPYRTKRALLLGWLNELAVHHPDQLIAALKQAMGANFDDFCAWVFAKAKAYYTAQRDDAQAAHDAIDELPEEAPEEPEL